MPTIVLRREAQLDLDKIDSFSRKRFGNEAADEYMGQFESAFRRLAEYPEIGAPFPYQRVPLRSYRVGTHRIFYYFDGQRVVVVRVLHQAMNMERHLSR